MAAWRHKMTVRMHQTDSAGVVFYANLFVMAHECYESWLEQYLSLSEILRRDIQIPIAHAEADYDLPLSLSDEVTIELALAQKKTTSFTLQYTFITENGRQAAHVKTVHVVIDSRTRQPVQIPSFLEKALSNVD